MFTLMLLEDFTMEIMQMTNETAKAPRYFPMAVNMKETLKMIRGQAKVFIFMLMAKYTPEIGLMANKMAKAL